jgi:hypothetical protein
LDGHVHHRHVTAWFGKTRANFASCAITQGTLLRMHMVHAADGSAAAAWRMLRSLAEHPRHEFWDDAFGYLAVPHRNLQGPRQVTDAWLAELARRRKARLATLDGGLATLHKDVAELIA